MHITYVLYSYLFASLFFSLYSNKNHELLSTCVSRTPLGTFIVISTDIALIHMFKSNMTLERMNFHVLNPSPINAYSWCFKYFPLKKGTADNHQNYPRSGISRVKGIHFILTLLVYPLHWEMTKWSCPIVSGVPVTFCRNESQNPITSCKSRANGHSEKGGNVAPSTPSNSPGHPARALCRRTSLPALHLPSTHNPNSTRSHSAEFTTQAQVE